jgi:hypothetical protein
MAKERKLSSFDRIVEMAMGNNKVLGCEDDPARLAFPALWEWLSTVYVGKDHVKAPATITIQLGPEGVLVRLADRDLASAVDGSCRHLSEVFQTLETTLTTPGSPMRSWGRKEPQLRKRKS